MNPGHHLLWTHNLLKKINYYVFHSRFSFPLIVLLVLHLFLLIITIYNLPGNINAHRNKHTLHVRQSNITLPTAAPSATTRHGPHEVRSKVAGGVDEERGRVFGRVVLDAEVASYFHEFDGFEGGGEELEVSDPDYTDLDDSLVLWMWVMGGEEGTKSLYVVEQDYNNKKRQEEEERRRRRRRRRRRSKKNRR
jgi:hypothetical protein